MPSSEFMKLEFQGNRFDGGELPLDTLRDLTALKEMIVEVAKWRFLEDNPARTRSPRGFAKKIDLKMIRIEEGSAVPVIAISTPELTFPGTPIPYQEYIEEATALIIQDINNPEQAQNQTARKQLPRKYLAYFDQVGRSLHENESLKFKFPSRGAEATLNQVTRRALISRSRIRELTQQVAIRGTIPEADQERMTFELQQIYGNKITGMMKPQHLDTIMEAFNGYREGTKEGTKVFIEGIGKFNQENRLLSLESIEQVNILDKLDVPARLDEMRNLEDGWATGMQPMNAVGRSSSRAPRYEGLDWLATVFEQTYPEDLSNPYAYPTPEGGVQIEWSIEPYSATLEINLEDRTGEWHSINLNTDESQLQEILLDELGWQEVFNKIKTLEPDKE